MKIYQSSANGKRRFCGDCGTQMEFQTGNDRDKLDVSIDSLDDPDGLLPSCHSVVESRLSFMQGPGEELPAAKRTAVVFSEKVVRTENFR